VKDSGPSQTLSPSLGCRNIAISLIDPCLGF
jgi:hypothetical protein